MERWILGVLSLATLASLPRPASAQVATDVRPPAQSRHYSGSVVDDSATSAEPAREKVISRYDISPLVIAGFTEGMGGGLQLDGSIFALRGSFAYMPVIAGIGEDGEGNATSVEVLHSYQVNADMLMFFWAPSAYSRIGISGGYRYNQVLDHGIAWGLQVEVDLAKHSTLVLSLSSAFFPEGDEHARDALGNPDQEVDFLFGPNFMSGAAIGMRLPI